jgi:hypothetical protein
MKQQLDCLRIAEDALVRSDLADLLGEIVANFSNCHLTIPTDRLTAFLDSPICSVPWKTENLFSGNKMP